MKTIPKLLVFGLVEFAVFGLMLFVPAGTVNYWQAWVFLAVVAISVWIPPIYLLRTNPVALQRRMRGGPTAEGRMAQKVVIAGLYLSLAVMVVISQNIVIAIVNMKGSETADIERARGLAAAALGHALAKDGRAAVIAVMADEVLPVTDLHRDRRFGAVADDSGLLA